MQTRLHDGIGARIYLVKKNGTCRFWIPSTLIERNGYDPRQTSKVHHRAQSLSYDQTLAMNYVTETLLVVSFTVSFMVF